MVSQIDPSIPHEGFAYTANVRANFSTAQQEISDLQDAVASLQTLLSEAQSDITTLKARYMAGSSVTTAAPPDTSSPNFVTAGLDIPFSPTSSTRAPFGTVFAFEVTQASRVRGLKVCNSSWIIPRASTDAFK